MSSATAEPRVTILTPVYNGEAYLRECLDSVLAQTYSNWEQIIVNNCSKDRTLEIAQEYAARDSRIRVVCNTEFVGVMENHNNAFRQLPVDSKYCKLVLADDWIFPECIAQMVRLAEAHPTIGIVGAYGIDGRRVLWDKLPYPSSFVAGREVCRRTLLGDYYVFGTPTSILMRSDLIRRKEPFYDESNLHADYEACFDALQDSEFGFVHQVLTYSRVHEDSVSSFSTDFNTYFLGTLTVLLKYGPIFLTEAEFRQRRDFRMGQYYQFLGKSLLRLREKKFWEFHRRRMQDLGLRLNTWRVARAAVGEALRAVLHPAEVWDGVRTWWPRRVGRARSGTVSR